MQKIFDYNSVDAERENADGEIREILGETGTIGTITTIADEPAELEVKVAPIAKIDRERYEELVKREAYLFVLLRLINHNRPYDKEAYFALVDAKCMVDAELLLIANVDDAKAAEEVLAAFSEGAASEGAISPNE